ncbi:MAG: protoporphyrinogen oxidase HemJ [Alphaproteobacteria bacterium]|nr:protoporphyrinogen oxidase HemJ [Alphaproteobacteria bacterium]
MLEALNPFYLWIKAFHIIAVIAWMAGMLYLPRLYVYHCEVAPGSAESARFKTMERRLLRAIVNPAMIATWLLGITLVLTPASGGFAQGWLHAKLLLVVALSAAHGLFSKWRKDFEKDVNRRPAKFYRIWNEVPAVLMIGIVILVVVKPF